MLNVNYCQENFDRTLVSRDARTRLVNATNRGEIKFLSTKQRNLPVYEDNCYESQRSTSICDEVARLIHRPRYCRKCLGNYGKRCVQWQQQLCHASVAPCHSSFESKTCSRKV